MIVLLFFVGFWYFALDNQWAPKRQSGGYGAQKVPNNYIDSIEDWKKNKKTLPLKQRTIAYYYPPGQFESYTVFNAVKARRYINKGERITKFMIDDATMNQSKVPFGVMKGDYSVVGSVAAMDIPPNAVIKADNIAQHPGGATMKGNGNSIEVFILYKQKHGWNYGP